MTKFVGKRAVYADQLTPLKGVSVRLPMWHVRLAKAIGGGVISAGIRKALEDAHKAKQVGGTIDA